MRALMRTVAYAVPFTATLVAAAPVTSLLARPADVAVAVRAARVDLLISGRVTDSGSAQPVEGAQVMVEGTSRGTVTAASGRYQLLVPGIARGARVVVVARRIGYSSVRREVQADSARMTVDFALSASATTLQSQVVVTDAAAAAAANRAAKVRGREAREQLARPGSRTESAAQGYATGMAVVGATAAPTPRMVGDVSGDIAGGLRRRSDAWNTEEYDRIEDNPFLGARQNPLSTFSIDVDRASYANVRRYLTQGQRPPKDAVRIEELVNYFRYDYAGPDGRHPVAIHTELAAAPWQPAHRLLRVGVQGRKIDLKSAPANNLVFLIDVSGSMQPENKLPLLKRAFALLVDELREEDRVSIVVYAGAAGMVLPPTSGADKPKIHAALAALDAGGSTAGGAGIRLAYDIAKQQHIRGGNNRVILATDGDFNVGVSSTSELVRLVEEKREQGTFLTVLGFGMGNYKDGRLEQLADKGNGNYAYIDDLLEARKTLVTELGGTLVTIAKDVKLQVEFNPARVAAYRLIGYENRLLRAEDFNDDKKDAGELGAGHTVTALYEIVPVGAEATVTVRGVDSLRYERPAPLDPTARPASEGGELAYVKLRYKDPDGSTSRLLEHPVANRVTRASTDFTFAAAVAAFGMVLRESEHKGNADWRMVAQLARAGRGEDAEGYRSEFIRLVEGTVGKELARTER
jgi:Ca-activated chloride channel family protein